MPGSARARAGEINATGLDQCVKAGSVKPGEWFVMQDGHLYGTGSTREEALGKARANGFCVRCDRYVAMLVDRNEGLF